MLTSLVVRYAGLGDRAADRTGAWADSLHQLRTHIQNGRCLDIPALRPLLANIPPEQRDEGLQDLIALHLQLSWCAGERRLLRDYAAEFAERFPWLGSVGGIPASLVEDEFLARCELPHGDFPWVSEYTRRFPNRPDVMARLAPRNLAAGRYLLLDCIGLGATGEVWRAYDRHLRTMIAIKRPRRDIADRAAVLQRLAAEVSLTARLNHPACVTLRLESPPNESEAFFVMRFAAGQAVRERIRELHAPVASVSPTVEATRRRELLLAFLAVCDAMAHVHQHGLVHRDLTPANIILPPDGQPLILDWGFACAANSAASHHGTVAGTPEYMAPEQAEGRADARSDVFGLGAILFAILTGNPPRPWSEECRPHDWQDQIRSGELRPCRCRGRGVPRGLPVVAQAALAHDPAARHADAAALAHDVRRALGTSADGSAWFRPFRGWWRWATVQR